MTLVAHRPGVFEIYIPAREPRMPTLGATVELSDLRLLSRRYRGRVIEVGPAVIQLPEQLWTSHNVPAWGRRILIDASEADAMRLIPAGQEIRAASDRSDDAEFPDVVCSSADDGPLRVRQPPRRRGRSAVERAGAGGDPGWSPGASSHAGDVGAGLVGLPRPVPGGDRRQRRRGRGNPAWPLRAGPRPRRQGRQRAGSLVGVDAIDDAESIVAGPDDTFFLLTSHSPNRRGKLHKSRCQLLALKLDKRKLVVTGAINLLHGHHDLVEELVALGLPASTTVDLEGLGYHDGTLYIGCKAPLLANRVGADPADRSIGGGLCARQAPEAESLCLGRGEAVGSVPEGGPAWRGSPICFSRPTARSISAPTHRRPPPERMAAERSGGSPINKAVK